jgi:hypothetical protein
MPPKIWFTAYGAVKKPRPLKTAQKEIFSATSEAMLFADPVSSGKTIDFTIF